VHNQIENPLAWSTFQKFYSKKYDAFKKMKKKTDYCDLCSKTHILLEDRATSQEEREEAQNILNNHLLKAQEARSLYNQTRQNLPIDTIMLSFDYAENILLPHLSEQPAIFYFKSRRKIEYFGITNEKNK